MLESGKLEGESMTDFIKEYIQDSIQTKGLILHDERMLKNIEHVANVIIDAYKNGKKVLVAGNGGSAADAQHIAGELVSKFYFERAGLSATALTVDTSILTAIGNDYGFEKVFSRQIQAQGRAGDVFIAISTSGNSRNIVEAIKEARLQEMISVGLTGANACEMDGLCNYIIKVPSAETPKIQESHIMLAHTICALVEKSLFEKELRV